MTKLRSLFFTLATYGIQELKIRTFRPFRRIRYFTKPLDFKQEKQIERQAMNTRFQGTGADMMKLALIRLHREFKPKYGDDCLFVLQVHDQVVLEVKDCYAVEINERAKVIMEDASKEMLKTLSVKVDGDISKIWKH
jgi:DNA polymerase-1